MFRRAIARQQLPSLPSRPSCATKLLSSSFFVVPSCDDSHKMTQLQPSNPSCPSGDAAPALHFLSFTSHNATSTVAFVGPSRDALQHYILPCIIIRVQPLPRILLLFFLLMSPLLTPHHRALTCCIKRFGIFASAGTC